MSDSHLNLKVENDSISRAIPVKELQAFKGEKQWVINNFINNFDSITPIKGYVKINIQNNIINIIGNLKTKVSLTCDKCLNAFNLNLKSESNELIWIGDSFPSAENLNHGIDPELIIDCIGTYQNFILEKWILEQLSLQIPVVNYCDKRCNINTKSPDESKRSLKEASFNYHRQIDPRWNELKKLLQK